MNGINRDYYIVDFAASRKYFHTHPLIIGISQFLTKNGHSPSILLPYIADEIESEFTSGGVNYILDAGYSSRNNRPLRHMTRKLLTIMFGSQHSGKRVKSYLRQTYIKSGLKYFQNIKNNHSKHIIFTTLEPLSLELALKLSVSSKMDNYYFYFRIIGAESRGTLSSNSELKLLLNLIKLYPKKIRIGVETNGYKSRLVDLGFPLSCIFWSPWPCLENFNKQKLKNRRLKIGFLGCAKQRKGFDNIPKILNHLKTEGFDFDVQIQEANFPWTEYEKTKNDIKLIMDDEFEFLSSNLELVELQDHITKCDLLILPYDSNSYSINASGVLYHACDSSVPVVTAKGVGFAAEIENFNLGLTYDNLDEIAEIVKNIQLMKYDFEYYNFQRNKANDHFLFINGII
jgi:hypothetical protein